MNHPAMVLLAQVLLCSSLPAATLVVEPNGRADFTDIQTAIDAAADGDLVSVLPGTYSISAPIDFNRLHQPGSPGSQPLKELEVRAAGPVDETVILLAGPRDPESASVVLFRSGEGPRSVLSGFTITGGTGSATPDGGHGGGGVLCRGGSSPTIRGCVIAGNSAPDHGGGVSCLEGSAPAFLECQVSGNGPARTGGGVACGPDGAPTFEGCLIAANRSTEEGGGIFIDGGAPVFKRCRIRGNRTDGTGGGLSLAGDAAAVLVNCLITGNIAGIGGAGLGAGGTSRPSLINCTLTGNLALEANPALPANGMGAGVLGLDRSTPTLLNCIVWGNSRTEIDVLDFSQAAVGFSLVGADVVWPGPGNLSGDPLFVLPGHVDDAGTPGDLLDDGWVEGDYHLMTGSPCIDTAGASGAPPTDLAGTSRPCQSGFDMGAFEGGNCAVEGTAFRRGDADADGGVDLNDPMNLLFFLFVGSPPPPCLPAADADHTDRIDLADPVYLLRYLFLGGEAPPEPFEACSVDPSPGDLHCADFAPCR